jgi:predicted DNA-binding helix-hairpin-helix protein
MVREFFEYRPYKALAQFHREIDKYVDDAELARLEQYVFVPIELNSASDADILTIPGRGRGCCASSRNTGRTRTWSSSAARCGSTGTRRKSRASSAT